jgi:filamentous hemagglutinin family protein
MRNSRKVTEKSKGFPYALTPICRYADPASLLVAATRVMTLCSNPLPSFSVTRNSRCEPGEIRKLLLRFVSGMRQNPCWIVLTRLPVQAFALGFLQALLVFGIPLIAVAGGPGKGSVFMNAAATQQSRVAAIGVQVQNAQSAVQRLGQSRISVFKGNNGVTLIRLNNPAAVPSNVLRPFQANGKVYAIDRNGIIFGGPHQVNTGALAAAAMDAYSNSQTKLAEQNRAKPARTEVPSIITTEVISDGQ